ncbi:sensor histidine kinase [Intestinibacter sp.]
MEINKGKSLYNIFLRYLITFCVLSIVMGFLIIILFNLSVNLNIVKPANYVQNQVEQLKLDIENGKVLNEEKIPYHSKYVFFDDKNKVTKTNLDGEELENAQKYLEGKNFNSKYIYNKINYKDGICVIGYDIRVHFTSEFWNNLIPYPEILLVIIFIIVFIGIACIIAIKFQRKLKKELYPLKLSTQKIMEQDLDFEIMKSEVKEFNEVQISISDMKNALKTSLETQWQMEQERKNQTRALAHDIKTPITIIRGNAELLNESDLCEEDKEFTKYIISNVDKIEKYVSILMEISNSEMGGYELNEVIDTKELLEELTKELEMLCLLKDINVSTNINYKTKSFVSNKELLMRAVTNIMSNAIDYSPRKSEVEFIVNENDGKMIFTVKDSGDGFMQNGLKNATNQFYMEANERKVGEHYGMGLYIANSVAKKHGGYVSLKNREDRSGAQVSIVIDIKNKM